MKKLFSLWFGIILCLSTNAQKIEWIDYNISEPLGFLESAIATDIGGNIYALGSFSGSVIIQGDTFPSIGGNSDCLLIKYDENGIYLWAKVFGSIFFDWIGKVAVDGSGLIYVSGRIQGHTYMNDTNYAVSSSYQVIQFDNNGNFLRTIFINDLAHLVAHDDYVYMSYSDKVEKRDASLNIIWSKSVTPSGAVQFGAVGGKGDLHISPGGHLVVCGGDYFGAQPAYFDTISFYFLNGTWNDEAFVISMDTSGGAYWAQTLYGPTPQFENAHGCAGDDAGNVYLLLRTGGQLVFGTDTLEHPPGNQGNYFHCVLKYNNQGIPEWSWAMYENNVSSIGQLNDLVVNYQNEIVVAGAYSNNIYGPPFSFSSGSGVILLKFDSNGNPIWKKQDKNQPFGNQKYFNGIVMHGQDKYAVTGLFSDNFHIGCFPANQVQFGSFIGLVSEDPEPYAAFSYSFNNLTFNFTDQSVGAWAWYWDFGDGNTSILQNPVHTYASTGLRIVSLSINDSMCVESASALITDSLFVGLVAQDANSLNLVLSPNPATDFIEISYDPVLIDLPLFEVHDVSGRKINAEPVLKVQENRYRISTTNYQNGVYFLTINTTLGYKTVKFTVLRN